MKRNIEELRAVAVSKGKSLEKLLFEMLKETEKQSAHQVKIIDDLQEKIKLLRFDISSNLSEISDLKMSLESKNKTLSKIKKQLIVMEPTNDNQKLKDILKMIKNTEKNINKERN